MNTWPASQNVSKKRKPPPTKPQAQLARNGRQLVKNVQRILERQAQFIHDARMPRTHHGFSHCPFYCRQPMRIERTVPKLGELPEMQTFECKRCRLAVTAKRCSGIVETASL
jgi:hypothetical protein